MSCGVKWWDEGRWLGDGGNWEEGREAVERMRRTKRTERTGRTGKDEARRRSGEGRARKWGVIGEGGGSKL